MPLRDHFHPPLADVTSWEGVQVEIDVAAIDRGSDAFGDSENDNLLAIAWAPTQPTLSVETELADPDEYEVRVYDRRRGRRLVAAVEIVSPANKDRPESRGQFVAKCAALLRQRVSVVMVDLVTCRDSNLYADLLALIDEHDATLGDEPPGIYAASSRWAPRGAKRWLDAWCLPLAVGEALPVLPLWLSDELAIPLDLEASYEQTCRDLRIC
jgi:hypothetical protein